LSIWELASAACVWGIQCGFDDQRGFVDKVKLAVLCGKRDVASSVESLQDGKAGQLAQDGCVVPRRMASRICMAPLCIEPNATKLSPCNSIAKLT